MTEHIDKVREAINTYRLKNGHAPYGLLLNAKIHYYFLLELSNNFFLNISSYDYHNETFCGVKIFQTLNDEDDEIRIVL